MNVYWVSTSAIREPPASTRQVVEFVSVNLASLDKDYLDNASVSKRRLILLYKYRFLVRNILGHVTKVTIEQSKFVSGQSA